MSTKKPTFLEVHCEKILVAIFSLLLVSAIVWQLLFLQIGVKVGSESVGLVDLEQKLDKKEREVSQKLEPTAPLQIEIPEQKKIQSSEIFQRERVIGLAPKSSLPPNQPSFSGLLEGGSISNNQWFYEPKFVAGKMGGVSITSDAVDLSQLSAEDLKLEFFNQFLPPKSSDVVWATPWIVVDLASMRKEFTRSNLVPPPVKEAIPKPWVNDSLYVLDLVFERRERLGNKSWSDSKVIIINPVPMQESWRPAIESKDSNASTRDTVFLNLSDFDMQMDVFQPSIFPMKGKNFIEPSIHANESEPIDATPEELDRKAFEKKNAKALSTLERLQIELKKAGGRLEPPAGGDSGSNGSDKSKSKGGGGGFGFGGGGNMKKGDAGNGDSAEDQADKELRIRLTKKVDQATKAFESLSSEFAKKYPAAIEEKKELAKNPTQTSKTFKDVSEILAWTHDFDVQEGSTYQYRTTVKIYNPFFTRKILLVPEQQRLSSGLAVSSTTSEWGEEVTIPSATSFFLTRGSARDGIGGRRISIDLFRYSSGVLRSTSEDLKLGDPVGSVVGAKDAAIDFSTLWYVADIFDDAGSDVTGGILAVFQRRTNTGELAQEIRSLSDKDSEIYKEFKKQLPEAQPKKVDPKTPKA